MSAGWRFVYASADGEAFTIPARDGAPFWAEIEGKRFGFVKSEFTSDSQMVEGDFWRAYQTARRPADPKESDAAENAAPRGFGKWSIQSALDAAARMSGAELDARCKYDVDFARALDASRQPEVPVDLPPNNASRDVAAWITEKQARTKRYNDSLKPLEDSEPRLSGAELYFGGVGFPAMPREPQPEPVEYRGFTKLTIQK